MTTETASCGTHYLERFPVETRRQAEEAHASLTRRLMADSLDD